MIQLIKTKKIVTFILLFTVLACSQTNIDKARIGNEYEFYVIHGPIKELNINTYEPVESLKSVVKGKLYNRLGKLGGGGSLKYFFDQEGNLARQISFKENSEEPKFYFEYKYKNKKEIQRITYNSPDKEKKNRKN